MIIKKSNSLLMKFIHLFLLIVTLGQQNKFMKSYVTTIGENIYIPTDWDIADDQHKDIVLFHENIHVQQYKTEGLKYALKYLFWPLPAIHAYARLEYELEAYAKDIVYSYRKYGTPVFGHRYNKVISQLSGPDYFWPCLNKKHIAKRLISRILDEMKATRTK